MIGVSVGYDSGACNVRVESVAGEEFIDASANERVVVSGIPPSPCVVTFLRVACTPDVNKIMLCGDSI